MRVLRLPDGDPLIPLVMPDPEDGFALTEMGPDDPDSARWLVLAAPAGDARPREEP
jgi:hypothetical protein